MHIANVTGTEKSSDETICHERGRETKTHIEQLLAIPVAGGHSTVPLCDVDGGLHSLTEQVSGTDGSTGEREMHIRSNNKCCHITVGVISRDNVEWPRNDFAQQTKIPPSKTGASGIMNVIVTTLDSITDNTAK